MKEESPGLLQPRAFRRNQGPRRNPLHITLSINLRGYRICAASKAGNLHSYLEIHAIFDPYFHSYFLNNSEKENRFIVK